jgi:glycosyltransferase involved in cell wall biosynthesis
MEQLKPQISVLMPAYNAELYIEESIQSVIEQTFQNWELIVLVDGATDQTKAIVQGLIGQDTRIRLIEHENNLGLIMARNHLLEAAASPYIAWLDADDICMPKRLEEQLSVFKQNTMIDVCASDYFTLEMSNQRLRRRKCYSQDSDLKALLSVYNPICNSTTMVKTTIAKQYPFAVSQIFAEDYDVWCRMASNDVCFYTIPEPLLTYRIHDHQISRAKQFEMDQAFLTSQLYYLKHWNIEQVPHKMPYTQRFREAFSMLNQLNREFKSKTGRRASFSANAEVYARFQYRGNGIFTILTRSERWLAAFYAAYFS